MYALVEGEKHKPERGLPNTGDKTMDHYTLAGEGAWYYKDEGGTEHELTESTDVTKDITAYLKWKGKTYTVTFDKKDGSVPAELSITYPVNKLETLAALDAAGTGTQEHYHCDTKWYLPGGAEFVAGPEGEGGTKIAEITGNITVTPNWEGNVYEMKYDANGGTGTLPDSITRTYPAAIAAFPDEPSRANWGFDGWYDTREASGGTKITTGYVLTGNMEVYARWDAGTVEITGITAKYGNVKAKINETISGGTINYTSSIPAFVVNESVIVSITAKATYGTPTISPSSSVTISYSSYSASSGSTASFTVTAPNGVAKTYDIKFTKDTTNKQMASGGDITYVKIGSGTSVTWDEVHKFTTTGTGQKLNFTAGRKPSGLKGRVLIVGGGGGGGGRGGISSNHGGGGGSGGVAYGASIELGDSTDVDVGKGGRGGDGSDKALIGSSGKNGDNGYQSSFGSAIAHGGGGGGGGGSNMIFTPGGAGNSGGSGGGGGGGSSSGGASGGSATQGSVPAGYDLKGSPGGSGSSSGDGGTGGTGGSANFTNDITGSNVTYGVGGLNGNSNTGNGGGGGATANEMGGDGGSGIVVVRFPFSDQ
jgi:uncharacterized repeat protein (TIGR02543 family)